MSGGVEVALARLVPILSWVIVALPFVHAIRWRVRSVEAQRAAEAAQASGAKHAP